jgi:hypothetical protein
MLRTLLPSLALLSIAACTASGDRWERPDRTPPTVRETSYCHEEARRQAAFRYPDQPRRDDMGGPRLEDNRRFPAEIDFYEQCMTRLGFVRVSAPAG